MLSNRRPPDRLTLLQSRDAPDFNYHLFRAADFAAGDVISHKHDDVGQHDVDGIGPSEAPGDVFWGRN